ncbi:hypothetical protein ACFFX0_18425 [Citricoccus parietis]|uniref:Uncharacterized protein n=1 Tax=Citricoccus parietis TaxID=592307 RepID=A0ABV5G2B1_9MICC
MSFSATAVPKVSTVRSTVAMGLLSGEGSESTPLNPSDPACYSWARASSVSSRASSAWSGWDNTEK